MTCNCSDPIVFGHHCGDPPPTFSCGETFTITGGQLTYTIGGTDRTIPLQGAQIHWGAVTSSQIHAETITSGEITASLPETSWDWLEAAQIAPNLLELRPTPQIFTNTPQGVTRTDQGSPGGDT